MIDLANIPLVLTYRDRADWVRERAARLHTLGCSPAYVELFKQQELARPYRVSASTAGGVETISAAEHEEQVRVAALPAPGYAERVAAEEAQEWAAQT